MQRDPKPDVLDLPTPSPHPSRTQSRSSDRDRTPSISGSSLAPPPQVSPEPAYIASSAASHVVNNELLHGGQISSIGDGIDEENAVTVSPTALSLINLFLDQLLFSFLASSRSTSILALRPAISEILKPRLAKEAIEGADEELRGYLAGGDDEELLDFHNGQELKGGSNLYQTFRRTRLRCMVYTRLGDMEEEDEEAYLEESDPQEVKNERHRLSRDLGNVSPAAAIFLTSIIEFVGEQALIVAGGNTFNRVMSQEISPRVSRHLVVEDRDVEKIAFNKTLGRLWRSWRKKGRISTMSSPRPSSHDSCGQGKGASGEGESGYFGDDTQDQPSSVDVIEENSRLARDIPSKVTDLPEEPDFSIDTDASNVQKAVRNRAQSMIETAWPARSASADTGVQQSENNELQLTSSDQRPTRYRQRSSSLPMSRMTPYYSPVDETFTTPTEGPDPFITERQGREKAEKVLPHLTDDSQKVAKLSSGNTAISTMYDGVLKRHSKPIPIHPALPNRDVSRLGYPDQMSSASDAEMTPQALNFQKPLPQVVGEGAAEPESRTSTLSSNYSFQAGEQSPLASTEDVTNTIKDNETGAEGVAYPDGDSLDRPRVEPGNFANLATVQGDRLKTYDESGKAVKRDIPVLYEAPSNEDVIYEPQASKNVLPDDGAQPSLKLRDSHGFAPAGGILHGDMPSPSMTQTQSTSAAAKFVDMRKTPSPLDTGTERAAVQRVSPSSAVTREPQTSGGRVSTSSNRDGRPMTPGSTTSAMSTKIKGITGRETGDTIQRPILRTTSSELSREITNGSLRSDNSNDKQQDFEQLIRSDETIQYTLTPQNMREMENPDSPRWSTKPPRLDSANSAHSAVLTGPALEKSVLTARTPRSLKGLNGLRSNPTQGSNVMEFATPSNGSPITTRSHPQPPPKSPSGKPKPIIARDATSQDGSLRDFADFIRSTGPDNDPRASMKPTSNKSAAHSRGGSNTSQQAGATSGGRKTSKQGPVVVLKKTESTLQNRTSSKLKARDPLASPTNTTAELADFFRSGPPGAQVSQRSVSSPKTNGRSRDGITSSISQDSFAPSKMTQSSSNSRTGLLDSTNRGPPVRNDSQRHYNDDPPGPIRKQRRVRDPYAIDSDDEDDLYGNPPEPEREEESLSDFLRNYTPPSTATGRPRQIDQSSSQPSQVGNDKQRKGSGVSMRERFARNIAVIPDYRPLPPKTPKKSVSKSPPVSDERRQQTSRTNPAPMNTSTRKSQRGTSVNNAPQASSPPQLPPLNSINNPRATSPHLISQNGTKMDTYRPTQPTYAKHVDRRPKQQLQARDESGAGGGGGGGSGLADLADFLRETEPPAPNGPISNGNTRPSPVSPPAKKEGNWGGMFGWKKKSVG